MVHQSSRREKSLLRENPCLSRKEQNLGGNLNPGKDPPCQGTGKIGRYPAKDPVNELDVDPRRNDDAYPMTSYRCMLRPSLVVSVCLWIE